MLQQKIAKQLASFVSEAKLAIIAAPIIYWDDTVIKINCLRVYTDTLVALYVAHETKSKAGVDEDGILLALDEETVVVHDHNIINYNDDYVFQNAECCVHLLRDLQKVTDNLQHEWAGKLSKLLTTTNANRNDGIMTNANEIRNQVKELVKLGWHEQEQEHSKAYYVSEEAALLRRIEKYADNYLMWLYNEDIPFSNNENEAYVVLKRR